MKSWPHHLGRRLAKVVRVYPESRTVDLVCMDNGQRLGRVQVMSDSVSTDSGSWRVPDVAKPASEQTADALVQGRNLVAVVDLVSGRPLVVGFVHPAGSEMTFAEQNREVHRHPSGAYTTVAPDGSMEVFHPSGAYFRIGTGAHQDLAAVSADGNWAIPAGAPPAQITLQTAGVNLTIMPNGAITLDAPQSPVTLTYQSATLNGDVHLNGALTATGPISTAADVVAQTDGAAVSLIHHTNGGQHVP